MTNKIYDDYNNLRLVGMISPDELKKCDEVLSVLDIEGSYADDARCNIYKHLYDAGLSGYIVNIEIYGKRPVIVVQKIIPNKLSIELDTHAV